VNSTENTTSVADELDEITSVIGSSAATLVLLMTAVVLLVVTETTPTVAVSFFRVAVQVPEPLRA
jgi:TRAP-type mannitol/chloroaromatic compound transport system permease small subunit